MYSTFTAVVDTSNIWVQLMQTFVQLVAKPESRSSGLIAGSDTGITVLPNVEVYTPPWVGGRKERAGKAVS